MLTTPKIGRVKIYVGFVLFFAGEIVFFAERNDLRYGTAQLTGTEFGSAAE